MKHVKPLAKGQVSAARGSLFSMEHVAHCLVLQRDEIKAQFNSEAVRFDGLKVRRAESVLRMEEMRLEVERAQRLVDDAYQASKAIRRFLLNAGVDLEGSK